MKDQLSQTLDSNKELIVSLYKSGVSTTKIAEQFRCYPQRITTRLCTWLGRSSLRPAQGNVRYFENIDSSLKAYFVGFIAADGCIQQIGSGAMSLSITLHNRDRVILEKLKAEIGCEHELMYIPSKDHVRFVLTNEHLISDLSRLGLGPRKSLTLGDFFLNIPLEFRKAAVLGLFDGDGSICVRYHQGKYRKQAVSFRATLEVCHGIIREMGLTKYHIATSDGIPNLVLSSLAEVQKFFTIYESCDFYLQRKYEKFLLLQKQDLTISSSTA